MVNKTLSFQVALSNSTDGVITSTKPGNETLNETITATVYKNENYRVAIRHSHESYLSIDTPTGDELACKALLIQKGFTLKDGWKLEDSTLKALYTSDVEQSRKNARIMGIMYGVIRGYEMNSTLIIHQQLNYDTCQSAHCTYQEMIEASKELVRYAEIVKKFLEARHEL